MFRMAEEIRPFTIDVPESVLDDLRVRLHTHVGRIVRTSTTGRRASRSPTCRRSPRTGPNGYDWRRREPRSTASTSSSRRSTASTSTSSTSARPRGRAAVADHARLARLDRRVPQGDRAARRSGRVRWRRGGRVPRRSHRRCRASRSRGKPTRPDGVSSGSAPHGSTLMARLGYDRYVAQGGDWGSAITTEVGAADPEHCAAIHITLNMSRRVRRAADDSPTSCRRWRASSTTSNGTPGTRPSSARGRRRSGSGWPTRRPASWHGSWRSSGRGPIATAIPRTCYRDEMLDNVMLYWVTNSATSSARMYWESFGRGTRPTGDRADRFRRLSPRRSCRR